MKEKSGESDAARDEGGGGGIASAPQGAFLASSGSGPSDWQAATMRKGLAQKAYSPLFRFVAGLLLQPWLVRGVSQPEAQFFLGSIAERIGKRDIAADLLCKAISARPQLAEGSEDAGRLLLASGHLREAETVFRRRVAADDKSLADWNGLALALHAQARYDEALKVLKRAIKLDPKSAVVLSNFSSALMGMGRAEEALSYGLKAAEVSPDTAELYANLGNIYQYLDRLEEAESSYRRVLEITPNFADAVSNLGNIAFRRGQMEEAEKYFRKALEINPNLAEAHSNLGNYHQAKKEFVEAETCYRRALSINSKLAEVWSNLGNALYGQGRLSEALKKHAVAVEMKPSYAEGHANLGSSYQALNQFADARESFRKAIALKPDLVEAHISLGNASYDLGMFDDAVSAYKKAIEIKETEALKAREALLIPHMCDSVQAMRAARDRLMAGIRRLRDQSLLIEDPVAAGSMPNFYLAYHNMDDRRLQEETANLYLGASPALDWAAPHCLKSQHWDGVRPIRIGFVSTLMRTTHTIGKLYKGIVESLPRDRFEVSLIRFGDAPSEGEAEIDKVADKVLRCPKEFIPARKLIADQAFDIIYYADIGMEIITYFLAFSRLAPVQCVGWGHPDTTGIPNIDYFISSEQIEPQNGEDHYSEKLVKLAHIPFAYEAPPLPKDWKRGRIHLNLPEDKRIYVCAQTLFKVHPDFEMAIGSILKKDKNAIMIFIKPRNTFWDQLLKKRLHRSIPDVVARIQFMPPLNYHDFMALNETADALLDTFHFSGGNSSLEAFAIGAPIVTLPGEFMRGRVTAGFYQQTGITELVAESPEHYIELALKLAQDKEFHAEMSRRIKEAYPAFIADRRGMAELAAFLTEAVARV